MASAAAREPQSSHTNRPTTTSDASDTATMAQASGGQPSQRHTRGGTSSPRRRAATISSIGIAAPTSTLVTTPEMVRTLENDASPRSSRVSATPKMSRTGASAASDRQRIGTRVTRSSVSACTATAVRLMFIPSSSTDVIPPSTAMAGPSWSASGPMAVPLVACRSAAGTAALTATRNRPTITVTITVPTTAPAARVAEPGSRAAASRWMPIRYTEPMNCMRITPRAAPTVASSAALPPPSGTSAWLRSPAPAFRNVTSVTTSTRTVVSTPTMATVPSASLAPRVSMRITTTSSSTAQIPRGVCVTSATVIDSPIQPASRLSPLRTPPVPVSTIDARPPMSFVANPPRKACR